MTTNRYIDMLQQGFMRPRKVRKVRTPGPIVACERCLDWHEKGKHRVPSGSDKKGSG